MKWTVVLACAVLVGCSTRSRAESTPTPECATLRLHGKAAEAQACFAKLAASSDPYLRAEAAWGLGQFQDANNLFRDAVKRSPKSADIRVRWGRMFLERFQPVDAGALFQEALKLDDKHAGAMLGMALVAAENFDPKAVEMARQALAADPKLLEAQELLAWLALEDSNPTRASEEADKALAMSPKAMQALSVKAAIEALADRPTATWEQKAFAINPQYGELHAALAHFMVLNRRYDEGIAQYEKALEKNARLWEARSELGVQLMRLGRDEDARRHLELCYANGLKNPATVNTLRLMDSYSRFDLIRTPKAIMRLDKKESELIRPYLEAEIDRAVATFEKKYKLTLPGPVQVELYPNHEDFAVRALGMPGLGALGVTFGTVVAMDSPNGRAPGTFHWASTLWHELSHVFVLTATNHRVPRWFTEGVAVHEETATEPDWGDRMDGDVVRAIQKKRLLPVAELDRGFIRPSYPGQVIISYFQAGRMCDFIVEKWGFDKILAMMQSFKTGMPTPAVVEKHLGMKPATFDEQFLTWLDGKVGAQVRNYDDWAKRMKVVGEHAAAKRHDDVIREGSAIRDLFPDFVEGGNVYEMLAAAHEAKGDKTAAIGELERYSAVGGRKPATLLKLAALQEEAGRKREAAQTLQRLSYVYLKDEALHRRMGGLLLEQGAADGAIRSYRALLALGPTDAAQTHYDLARAFRAAKRDKDALEQVTLALEAAPGFRPAQKMLLELTQGGSSD